MAALKNPALNLFFCYNVRAAKSNIAPMSFDDVPHARPNAQDGCGKG